MGSFSIPTIPLRGVGIGPKGGDLEKPNDQPQARRAEFRGVVRADGTMGLHRFEDNAIPGRMNEKPWHRMAAFMLLAGKTNKEIAAAAGVEPCTVSQIRSNRWFQELLATLANDAGESVIGILQAEAVASLEKMIAVRDNPDAPLKAQYQAAKDLVELAHGKAVQRTVISTTSKTSRSPQDEFADIQSELEALRKRRAVDVVPNTNLS